MGKKKTKWVYLKVTTTSIYTFEERSINGWDAKKVIDEWFHNFPLDTHHATRDPHQVENSTLLVSAYEISEEAGAKYVERLKEQGARLNERRRVYEEELFKLYPENYYE